MSKKPIHRVISEVLREAGKAMSSREIYEAIAAGNLYPFQAKDPANIVRGQLRRHSANVKSPPGSGDKYFEMTEDGKFKLLVSRKSSEST